MKLKPDLLPLIDGDIVLYRMGYAADSQAKKELDGEEWMTYDYLGLATKILDTGLQDVINTFSGSKEGYRLYITGKNNFRDTVATIKPYKGNRDPNKKPKYYKELKARLISKWGAVVIDGIEADDAMGTEQFSRPNKSSVIVSTDKDLKMIPGYHYNPTTGEFINVKLKEANLSFLRQMLLGDPTDNIPGAPGIGKKTIATVLPDGVTEEKAIEVVAAAYKSSFQDNAIPTISEIARLLWIRRTEGEDCPYITPISAEVMNGKGEMEALAQIAHAKKWIRKKSSNVS